MIYIEFNLRLTDSGSVQYLDSDSNWQTLSDHEVSKSLLIRIITSLYEEIEEIKKRLKHD